MASIIDGPTPDVFAASPTLDRAALDATPTPESVLNDGLDAIARIIHAAFRTFAMRAWPALPTPPDWVPDGNSNAQHEARRTAREVVRNIIDAADMTNAAMLAKWPDWAIWRALTHVDEAFGREPIPWGSDDAAKLVRHFRETQVKLSRMTQDDIDKQSRLAETWAAQPADAPTYPNGAFAELTEALRGPNAEAKVDRLIEHIKAINELLARGRPNIPSYSDAAFDLDAKASQQRLEEERLRELAKAEAVTGTSDPVRRRRRVDLRRETTTGTMPSVRISAGVVTFMRSATIRPWRLTDLRGANYYFPSLHELSLKHHLDDATLKALTALIESPPQPQPHPGPIHVDGRCGKSYATVFYQRGTKSPWVVRAFYEENNGAQTLSRFQQPRDMVVHHTSLNWTLGVITQINAIIASEMP